MTAHATDKAAPVAVNDPHDVAHTPEEAARPTPRPGVHVHIPKVLGNPRPRPTPFAPACALFRSFLRNQGLKFTPERAAVLDTVLREAGLFDAEIVVDRLKQEGHRGSRATVYRTLSHLHESGILKQVFFDNTQAYYEVILGRTGHDYLLDAETGRVVEFLDEAIVAACREACRRHGFEYVGHQLHVYGRQKSGADPE